MQGLGVEARDVKKALARANPPYVTPEKYVTKLPKDCARRGKLFTITTPWGNTWGPKNWYFDRLQKLWPKIMFIQENKPKKRVVKSRASGSLYRPARWQEEKKKNFWNFFFSGTQKPVYERLSERSKEVLRVAQMETFRAKVGGFETFKVGTAALFLALTMVAEGAIAGVFNQLFWNAAALTRNNIQGWFSDPFARLRVNGYLKAKATEKKGNSMTFLFTERFKGLGGAVKEWGEEKAKFSRYYGYYLETNGENLCRKFLEGRIDSCSGRDSEISRGLMTLARRFKNNPCYLGSPGVGKSALVEGMAALIVCGLVKKAVRNKVIYCVELMKLVAGTYYRGEFETKLFGVIGEVSVGVGRNVVIFIDEVHSLVGAGEADGAVDASTLLKPYMSRGKISIIGASTFREFESSIGRDPALERRFRIIEVLEPTRSATYELILSLALVYETYHGVIYSFDAFEGVVGLSIKYLTTRRLPDKALDLFDECASTRSLKVPQSIMLPDSKKLAMRDARIRARFWDYGDEMEYLVRTLEEEDLPFILAQSRLMFGIPLKNRGLQTEIIQNRLMRLEAGTEEAIPMRFVNSSEVFDMISHWTGVVRRSTSREENATNLHGVENVLSTRVVGQYAAVSAIGRALRRARAEIRVSKRPIACFLFCGPTGVGKTEVVKALSFFFFGSEESMVRLDMGEYSERESTTKLIGPGPGYVGAGVPGTLSGPMQIDPRRVVLFDEVEKCAYEVRCLFLQVLEEASLRDGSGRLCDFRRALIVATSNVGSMQILLSGKEALKKTSDPGGAISIDTVVRVALRAEFAPEFLNRFDEIVIFNPVSPADLVIIQGVLFKQIQERLCVLGAHNQLTTVTHFLMGLLGFSSTMGVRPMKRMFSEVFDFVLAWSCVVEAFSGRRNAHLIIDVGFISKEDHQLGFLNPTGAKWLNDYGGYKVRRSLGC
jgi:ATP-dependent Clp protease ATP-binding subunit ClpC